MAGEAPNYTCAVMHSRILALGGVPVIDDLEDPTSYVLLFEQLMGLIPAPGGGGVAFAANVIAPGGPGSTVTITSFHASPPTTGPAGANYLTAPVPPAAPLAGPAGPLVMLGPAVPAFVASFDPVDIASVVLAAGPLGPFSFALEITLTPAGSWPSLVVFTFEGTPGYVFIDIPVV